MPINTDLRVPPYSDDYNEKDDYYKILFKPGVAVQVRELNQLQTLLQKQVERFGDNIYRQGTIVKGCNFTFQPEVPYIKILDNETDTTPVNVNAYKGYFVRNEEGLKARIVEVAEGFESTSPDLNTLYLKYLNQTNINGNKNRFEIGQPIQIYSGNYAILDIDVISGSDSFKSKDIPVFLSAIEVKPPAGTTVFVNNKNQACTFSVGEIITQKYTKARAEIIEVNTSVIEDSLVLKIKPITDDLRTTNTAAWDFKQNYEIKSGTTKINGNVKNIIGSGAKGILRVDSDGTVESVLVTSQGKGYSVLPYLTLALSQPSDNTSYNEKIENLNLIPKDYFAEISISSEAGSIGTAYGLAVSEGIIYQKGYFSRVKPSFTIVEKYSSITDKVVGFDTIEEIITYRQDSNLNDNSFTTNRNAPGADRLKLQPFLVSIDKDTATSLDNFLPIIEFSEGRPFKQLKTTQFNSINQELARRTYEESGDYVLDPFLVKMQPEETIDLDSQSFELLVDPGLAYIKGNRVKTEQNYVQAVRKGTDTIIQDIALEIQYGNFIIVSNLAGQFPFNVGAQISFYNKPQKFLNNYAGNIIDPSSFVAGSRVIGVARIRSWQLISGLMGTPSARYKLYLFDINMYSGNQFISVRSVYYSNATSGLRGVADIDPASIIHYNESTNRGITRRYGAEFNSLIFPLKQKSVKAVTNLKYEYRTINNAIDLTDSGSGTVATIQLQTPGEYFPYKATLDSDQKKKIFAIPLSDCICTNTSLSTYLSAASVTGGTRLFTSDQSSWTTGFKTGDYIYVANSTVNSTSHIKSIANNNSLVIANTTFTMGADSGNVALFFPQSIPIDLRNKEVTVTANTTLTVNLGNTINDHTGRLISIAYDAVSSRNQVKKNVKRKQFVKIRISSQANEQNGPWCIGVPDVIQLRNVYIGNTSTVTTSDKKRNRFFHISHEQRKNSYKEAFLHKNKDLSIPAGTYILVEFDCLVPSAQGGAKSISSYPINDTLGINSSISTINTIEVPEVYTNQGEKIDLRDCIDLRPYAQASANLVSSSTDSNISVITKPKQFANYADEFDYTSEKRFPNPNSELTATVESYLGRKDIFCMTSEGNFEIIEGKADLVPSPKKTPADSMYLATITIPPYPSYPNPIHPEVKGFLRRKSRQGNTKTTKRMNSHMVTLPTDFFAKQTSQPKGYTMADIGSLERRIETLEYYTALSFTEDEVNKLQIPSSVDGTNQRYKFGFFVDNFTTINNSNVFDTKYHAQIMKNEMVPKRSQNKIDYKFNMKDETTQQCFDGATFTVPYKIKTIIDQSWATDFTNVDVSITETITTLDREKIITTGTRIDTIETTEFLQSTRSQYEVTEATPETRKDYNVQTGTKIEIIDKGQKQQGLGTLWLYGDGRSYQTNNYDKTQFTVGKTKGWVYVYGNVLPSGTAGMYGKLQRKINGVWTDVGNSTSGTNNIIAACRDIDANGDLDSWMKHGMNNNGYVRDGTRFSSINWISWYFYSPNNDFSDREFRVLRSSGTGWGSRDDIKLYVSYWPISEDRIVPVYEIKTEITPGTPEIRVLTGETQTSNTSNYSKTTETEILYKESIRTIGTISSETFSLFESQMTPLYLFNQLFTKGNINSPYVNLAESIYKDINGSIREDIEWNVTAENREIITD